MPSGTPTATPSRTGTRNSRRNTRAASRRVMPVATITPNCAARRSMVSRQSSPTNSAAATTMKKLMDTNSTPKSDELRAPSIASAYTSRTCGPRPDAESSASSAPRSCPKYIAVTQPPPRSAFQKSRMTDAATNALGSALCVTQ